MLKSKSKVTVGDLLDYICSLCYCFFYVIIVAWHSAIVCYEDCMMPGHVCSLCENMNIIIFKYTVVSLLLVTVACCVASATK